MSAKVKTVRVPLTAASGSFAGDAAIAALNGILANPVLYAELCKEAEINKLSIYESAGFVAWQFAQALVNESSDRKDQVSK